MLCFLSVRKLKPGSYEKFREAWEPEERPSEITRIFHVRSVNDENVVVSFGLADDMTPADLDAFRAKLSGQEDDRQSRMDEHVDQVLVDDVFEVVEEIDAAKA